MGDAQSYTWFDGQCDGMCAHHQHDQSHGKAAPCMHCHGMLTRKLGRCCQLPTAIHKLQLPAHHQHLCQQQWADAARIAALVFRGFEIHHCIAQSDVLSCSVTGLYNVSDATSRSLIQVLSKQVYD